jgi:uncharacterized alpha/beta hydrolase family protein
MTELMLRDLADIVGRYHMGYVAQVKFMMDSGEETDFPLLANYYDAEIRYHAGGGKHGQAFFAWHKSEHEKGWQETV